MGVQAVSTGGIRAATQLPFQLTLVCRTGLSTSTPGEHASQLQAFLQQPSLHTFVAEDSV